MVTLSSSLTRQSQRRIRAVVLAYLKEHSLASTIVRVHALEGMIYKTLFDSLYRQLRSRQGNVSVLLNKYDDWLRVSLDTVEFLTSMRKATSALAYLVTESGRLDLRDLRAGRHKAGLPHDAVLFSQIEQVRVQLTGLPRKTKRNHQERVTSLSGKLNSPAIKTIIPSSLLPIINIGVLAQSDPLDIALSIVAASTGNKILPENLKKRLPGMRRKAKASLSLFADLLN